MIINSGIINNQGDGIYIGDNCFALIGGNRDNANDIFGNTEYAVRNDSTNDIDATYNYWGATAEVEIRDAIWDYYDDPSKSVVNYEPWIDGTHRKIFPFAQALNLDGDGDWVEVEHNPVFDISDVITLEAWVNLDRLPNAHSIIVGYRNEDAPERKIGFGYGLEPENRIKVWTNSLTGEFYDVVDPNTELTPGKWYHVACTHTTADSGLVKIYVNGKLTYSEESNNPVEPPGSPASIGIGAWGGEFWPGLIDEVRIWNVARTQEEIQTDMNQPLENPQLMPDLVGYWNFDDGTANDSSPYGNHGTLEGDAEIVPLYGTWPPPKRGDVSGDNTVSAYDAALILRYVVGLIDEFPADSMVSPSAIEPNDYELSLPTVETPAGEKIQVPISINDATGLLAGGVTVKYDQTVLRAVDYAPLKLLNGYYWKANTNLPGEVRFAFATTFPPL